MKYWRELTCFLSNGKGGGKRERERERKGVSCIIVTSLNEELLSFVIRTLRVSEIDCDTCSWATNWINWLPGFHLSCCLTARLTAQLGSLAIFLYSLACSFRSHKLPLLYLHLTVKSASVRLLSPYRWAWCNLSHAKCDCRQTRRGEKFSL